MKKILFFIIFLCFNFLSAFAFQEIKVDSLSTINERIVKKEAIEKYLHDKKFDYSKEITQAPESLWDRFLRWLQYKILELLNMSVETKQIRFLIIVGVISLVVFLLLKTEIRGLFFKNRQRAKINYEVENEDIRKINLDNIISEAIQQADYRKAVRYLYLKLLKELDNKEFIVWKMNKTNRDYLSELANNELKPEFKYLSMVYEYVWYGDFSIQQTNFNTIHSSYKNYFDLINKK